MTFADAVLIVALASLVLVALIVLIVALGWLAAVLIMGAAEDEPYEYQPLYLVTREDR